MRRPQRLEYSAAQTMQQEIFTAYNSFYRILIENFTLLLHCQSVSSRTGFVYQALEDHPDRKDREDVEVSVVLKEAQERQENKASKALWGQQGRKDRKETKEILDPGDHKDRRE